MSTRFPGVDMKLWAYRALPFEHGCLIEMLRKAVASAIASYDLLPEGPEPGSENVPAEFKRVSVNIPVSRELYDQFFNGPSGYRAQYYLSEANGVTFNRALIDSVVPQIVRAENLYTDKFDRDLCARSLLGSFSKLWFSKQISDPIAEPYLNSLPEVIKVDRWQQYWKDKNSPRKGLLAPLPEETTILLNGTFVNPVADAEFEPKTDRAKELFKTGWT